MAEELPKRAHPRAAAVSKKSKAKTTSHAVDLHALPTPEYWNERVALFDRLFAEQAARYEAQRQSIKVTLPTGTTVEAESWVSCPLDIARRLSNSLADRVVVARVNDQLWDLTRPLEEDCRLELLEWDDHEAQHVFWHSSAHVLGYAMERVFRSKLSVGPALEEGGFFYEGLTDRPVSESDYATIEAAMAELVKQKMPYQRLVISKEKALKLFHYTEYKSKMLTTKVADGGTCTVYKCGMLIDPCRGPHLVDTGRVKSFVLTKNSSSFYEGKAENEVLQRVYGMSFPKTALMEEWKKIQEEAARRDHRVVGRQQQLFLFNEVSPGSAFWLPHGTRVYNTLMQFLRKQYARRGFDEVISPNIYSSKLWMVSGHWEKYADNMFCTVCEKEDYGMKPMNCPGHCIMFAMQQHSYKELPIRYADFGVLHRNELSGALTGLTRVRRFQQDDAHIFCRMDQITDEIGHALEFLRDVYGVLGFKFFFRHSTRPENKLGSEETWDEAESYLRTALNRFCGIPDCLPDPFAAGQQFTFDGLPPAMKKLRALQKQLEKSGHIEGCDWGGATHANAWEENTGDGAFYGPKIDIVVEDALRRRHQCATIQLDFNLPNRFGLRYTLPAPAAVDGTADGAKERHADPQSAPSAHAQPALCHPSKSAEPSVTKPAATYESVIRELGINLELDANQARPVMIHRAIMGSMERCIAILCEHYGGEWPFWLSPRQVIVIPISGANVSYAQAVCDRLCGEGFYAEVDSGASTLDKKIRNAELARFNFIFVVGQQEEATSSVNVRARGEKRIGNKTQEEAIAWLRSLAESYSRDY